jgi:hypothetical protein
MTRTPQGDGEGEKLRLFLNPPSSTGQWGDLNGLEPRWVYLECQKILERADQITPSAEETVLASNAYQNLPPELRPVSDGAFDAFIWIEEEGYAVVSHTNTHMTTVVAFNPDKNWEFVLLLQLDSRQRHGTATLYRQGEKLTLPW